MRGAVLGGQKPIPGRALLFGWTAEQKSCTGAGVVHVALKKQVHQLNYIQYIKRPLTKEEQTPQITMNNGSEAHRSHSAFDFVTLHSMRS